VNIDVNCGVSLTQSYNMSSVDPKYSAQVNWTVIIVLFWCFSWQITRDDVNEKDSFEQLWSSPFDWKWTGNI